MSGAQRRPGPKPRRQASGSRVALNAAIAQQGPERRPRRGSNTSLEHMAEAMNAQRRPGRNSGDRRPDGTFWLNYGDAAQRRPEHSVRRQAISRVQLMNFEFAQRRPGRRPWRQVGGEVVQRPRVDGRSTKAGVETPATPNEPFNGAGEGRIRSTKTGAQPRRQCWNHLLRPERVRPRSTKAGDRPRRQARLSNPRRRRCPTLNESRARGPATVEKDGEGPRERLGRSTKAEAETPGDRPSEHLPEPVLRHRSTKAGAKTPATVLGLPDVSPTCERSTKAGADTPATLIPEGALVSYREFAQRRPG